MIVLRQASALGAAKLARQLSCVVARSRRILSQYAIARAALRGMLGLTLAHSQAPVSAPRR